jgi:hypothetical protein
MRPLGGYGVGSMEGPESSFGKASGAAVSAEELAQLKSTNPPTLSTSFLSFRPLSFPIVSFLSYRLFPFLSSLSYRPLPFRPLPFHLFPFDLFPFTSSLSTSHFDVALLLKLSEVIGTTQLTDGGQGGLGGFTRDGPYIYSLLGSIGITFENYQLVVKLIDDVVAIITDGIGSFLMS